MIFVGPADLGLRLRQSGEMTLEEAWERVAAACRKHGVPFGGPALTPGWHLVAGSYDLVQRPELKYPPFTPSVPEGFSGSHDMFEAMRQGDVRDFSNFVAAVIDRRAFRKHVEYQAWGNANAETVWGVTADDRVGWYVTPTVYRVDDPRARLMEEEVFGPIASIQVVAEADEAIRLAAKSEYGLGANIYTADIVEMDRAARELVAGMVWVNAPLLDNAAGPFGGRKMSGIGRQLGQALTAVERRVGLADIGEQVGVEVGGKGREIVLAFEHEKKIVLVFQDVL